MRYMRAGIIFVLVSQGLYWFGVLLERGGEPMNLLGLLLAHGYRNLLFGMTAVGLVLIVAGLASRRRRSAG